MNRKPIDPCTGIEIRTSPQGVRYAWHADHAPDLPPFDSAPELPLTGHPILLDDLRDATRGP